MDTSHSTRPLNVRWYNPHGLLHLSLPPDSAQSGYLERMRSLENLLLMHTWFAEGSRKETVRNVGTLADGWLERYGIDAVVHEFNCQWSAGLGRSPLGRDWEQYGEGLARVFDAYFEKWKCSGLVSLAGGRRPGAGPR